MNNSTSQHLSTGMEIAVIGLSGRFPGARTVEQFWLNLRDGVESISVFSERELEASRVAPAIFNDSRYVSAGAVLDDIDLFDASFFGFTPREAELTDPQHRLFLECTAEALENAGYDSQRDGRRVGVYAGAGTNTYFLYHIFSNPELINQVGEFQTLIGNDKDHLATLTSYKLNLRGPSLTVQTACSTSLVAIHLACRSLLGGECDMALAGGVSISVPQKIGYLYQEGGIYSPDGHCRAFDADARGTVCGSGVGIVVLKRLDDALTDGDFIHAIIKGSAINNDGSLKVGYAAPGVTGQAEAISMALAVAEVEPETVTYVEAHGTATPVGDPIEIAALTQSYRARSPRQACCAVGSVKTNIGHLDAAAGVAGLIKTVMALKHKQLPPSLHFKKPNAAIEFDGSPFYVNTSLRDWKSDEHPRRAGVSSFGIGGTNAHVILEEAPEREAPAPAERPQLLLLSARTRDALATASANLIAHLKKYPDENLADIAYTLQVGRRAFNHRQMCVCDDLAAAVEMFQSPALCEIAACPNERSEPFVAFMFPGQGSQYVNMGLKLYQREQAFRWAIDECSEGLASSLGLDLRSVLYPSSGQNGKASALLAHTSIARPALFVFEYALARLWMKWGVRPQAMIGEGVGQYVAACLAGVFSLEDVLRIVALGAFGEQAGRIKLEAPSVPLISNLTGDWITPEQATEMDYWAGHLYHTERFADGVARLRREPDSLLLEVGPGQTLSALTGKGGDADSVAPALSSLSGQGSTQSDEQHLFTTLGRLWLAGANIDWSAVHEGEQRRRVPLPTYPFERQRYWVEPHARHVAAQTAEAEPGAETLLAPRDNDRPTNEVERIIIRIWQDLFGVERIGVQDNFFELGGNSLLAIQIITQIRTAFQIEVPMDSFLNGEPTVAGLARVVMEHQLSAAQLREIDSLLDELEGVSPEEMQAIISQGRQSGEEEVASE